MSGERHKVVQAAAITACGSVATILGGIVSAKTVALLLGPEGLGMFGLCQSILAVASTVAGLGIARSGVRQIATASDRPELLVMVRRALSFGALVLGITGTFVFWLLREEIAENVLGNPVYADEVGLLAFGVGLTVLAASQSAVLQGLRRVSDLARTTIAGALIGTTVGIGMVYWQGLYGIIWLVLAVPAFGYIFSCRYVARLSFEPIPTQFKVTQEQLQELVRLGVPLMAATLVSLGAQLIVRAMVQRELGLEASGNFQAAWVISMTYVNFVVGAMVSDFFPRLSASITDHAKARKLVTEQGEVAFFLSAPLLVGMAAFAPTVIHSLYDSTFTSAAEILRWQAMGDVLKIASWPMGIILAAQGRSGTTLFAELCWGLIYVAFVYFGIPLFGLVSAGMGFLVAYSLLLIMVAILAYRLIDYRPSPLLLFYPAVLVSAIALVIFGEDYFPEWANLVLAVVVTLAVSAFSAVKLASIVDIRRLIGNFVK